ncbi:MAG: hypothetical protein WD646_13280 [Actinomycetota bacterium]
MTRLRRVGAVLLFALAALPVAAGTARADHCKPIDNPPPLEGQNTTYCHTPKPTATPKATPSPAPTPAPTSAPAPAATRRPVSATTAAPVQQEVEVPAGDTGPLGTPEILVDAIDPGDENFETEPSASASSWIFGFIVGLIVGGLAGRASWGLRRKRRQQIFG